MGRAAASTLGARRKYNVRGTEITDMATASPRAQARSGYDVEVEVYDVPETDLRAAHVTVAVSGQGGSARHAQRRLKADLREKLVPPCALCDYVYVEFVDVNESRRGLAGVLAFIAGLEGERAGSEGERAGEFCLAPCTPQVLFRLKDARSDMLARHVLLQRGNQDPCFQHMRSCAIRLAPSGDHSAGEGSDSGADRGDASGDDSGVDEGLGRDVQAEAEFASLATLCAAGQYFLGMSGKHQLEAARAEVCGAVADALATGGGGGGDGGGRPPPSLPLHVFVRRPRVSDRDLHAYRARCGERARLASRARADRAVRRGAHRTTTDGSTAPREGRPVR
jgi:hypothetical protein